MKLTEKEEKFIRHYQKFYITYILLFIFITLVSSAQFYLFFKRLIPAYTKPFFHSASVLNFVKDGLIKTLEVSFFWIALFIGCLIGDFLNYIKIRRIINKLRS
jgi:hypothetical protein